MSYSSDMDLKYFDFQFQNHGEVWRGTLPYITSYNTKSIDSLITKKFNTIVLLLSDEECISYRKINLRELYLSRGFEVIHLPISASIHTIPVHPKMVKKAIKFFRVKN